MGGSAFGKDRPASRLSTPQFRFLQTYCQDRLAPHFTQVLPLLSFSEKMSHGDVDLISAHVIPFDQKKVKGEDWGVIGDTGEDEGKGAWHPVQGGRRDAAEGKQGEQNAKYRAWVVDIVRTLSGREWKRSGVINGFINVGIPISRLEGLPGKALLAEGVLDEPFLQVDIQILAPQYLPFTHFVRSYGNILLTHAITLISPHLKLHGSHLGFHYNPYPGLKPIKFELTLVPSEFCDWLGLDYDRFQEGFDNERDLWLWVTNSLPMKDENGVRTRQGKIEESWKAVVNPDGRRRAEEVVSRKARGNDKKSKNPAWQAFLDWLRWEDDSPFKRDGPFHEPNDRTADVAASSTQLDQTRSAHDNAESPQQAAVEAILSPAQTVPSLSLESAIPAQPDRNIIDIGHPVTLCPNAKEALHRWARWDEFELAMHSRREEAMIRAASQRKNRDEANTALEARIVSDEPTVLPASTSDVTAEVTEEAAGEESLRVTASLAKSKLDD